MRYKLRWPETVTIDPRCKRWLHFPGILNGPQRKLSLVGLSNGLALKDM
jgi:hypothetical protein